MSKATRVLICLFFCTAFVIFIYTLVGIGYRDKMMEQEIELIHNERQDNIEQTIEGLREELKEIRDDMQELHNNIEHILEITEVKEVDLSFYAPLDANAVEGMCFSGDPNITASGERVVIGDTIAAGPDVPFYTRVYLEGRGMYTVHDRGDLIGNDNIDEAVLTKEEAFRNGVVTARAVFFYPGNLQNVE